MPPKPGYMNDPLNPGNYPLSAYAAVSQPPIFQPDMQSQVSSLFGYYGVPLTYHSDETWEDPQARLNRISQDLLSGTRDWNQVTNSVQLLSRDIDPNLRSAEQIAAYEFNPQEAQLRRALGLMDLQQVRDQNAVNYYNQYGQEALQNTYDQLNRILTENAGAVQGAYGAARQGTDAAYSQANQLAQGAQDAALADTSGEAAALGVRGAVVDPHAELRNRVSELIGFNAQGQADAASVLNNMMAGFGAVNSQGVSDAAMEGALMQDRQNLQAGQMLSDLMGQYGEQRFDTLGQLNDLSAQRGARVGGLQREFEEQAYGRQRERTLDELAAEIQRGTLDLQRQELGFNRERLAQEMGLNWAQFGLDERLGLGQLDVQRGELALRQQEVQNQLLTEQDPLRRRQLELENALLEQEIARGNLPGGGATAGQGAVDAILNRLQGPYASGQDPRTVFNALRTAAISAATSDPRYGGDPYAAFEYLLSTGSNPNPSLDALMRSLGEAYWGVYQ